MNIYLNIYCFLFYYAYIETCELLIRQLTIKPDHEVETMLRLVEKLRELTSVPVIIAVLLGVYSVALLTEDTHILSIL